MTPPAARSSSGNAEGLVTEPSGMAKTILRHGKGQKPSVGDIVSFTVESCPPEFRSVADAAAPNKGDGVKSFTAALDDQSMPPGYAGALATMEIGEIADFYLDIPQTVEMADRALRLHLTACKPKLGPRTVIARNPIAAISLNNGVLFCIAEGLFQPLHGAFAELLQEPLKSPVEISALFERYGADAQEQEIVIDLIEYFIEMGILAVQDNEPDCVNKSGATP